MDDPDAHFSQRLDVIDPHAMRPVWAIEYTSFRLGLCRVVSHERFRCRLCNLNVWFLIFVRTFSHPSTSSIDTENECAILSVSLFTHPLHSVHFSPPNLDFSIFRRPAKQCFGEFKCSPSLDLQALVRRRL